MNTSRIKQYATAYFFLHEVNTTSGATTMEKELFHSMVKYKDCVISGFALIDIIDELKEEQLRIKTKNPRLKEVEISTSTSDISNVVWLSIGRNSIVLHKITGFVE